MLPSFLFGLRLCKKLAILGNTEAYPLLQGRQNGFKEEKA